MLWLAFVIGSAVAYALVATLQWLWAHRVATAKRISRCKFESR